MVTLEWELVKQIEEYDGPYYGDTIQRAKTPGGWLVKLTSKSNNSNTGQVMSLTFVPDPEHEWK